VATTTLVGVGDARVAGRRGLDAVYAGGGRSARRTEHERTGCGEHFVGSADDARVAGWRGLMLCALEGAAARVASSMNAHNAAIAL
jgi:hypothetical protein